MACNSSRTVWKHIKRLDPCDISDNSDGSGSRQEQTCLQQFVSAIGNIKDSVGHGSLPCQLLFCKFGQFQENL